MAKSSSFSRGKGPSNPRKKSSFHPGGKSSFLNRKAKAEAGYAKRKDKKKQQGDVQDVYEYLPEKTRRSKVRLDLDKSEAQEFGGNLDEFDDSQRETLRARLIGENDDDERLDSEDDEELDSDAAFEESDEERFAEFFGNKKKKKPSEKKQRTVRFTDVDLNEDDDEDNDKAPAPRNNSEESEEEEEEGEDDEFIDLLDVLDGKGEIDMGSDDEKPKKPSASSKSRSTDDSEFGMDEVLPDEDFDEDMDDNEGSGSSEEDEDEEDEAEEEDEEEEDNQIQITASDDEENDLNEDALSNLQTFVSNLDTVTTSQKRKASADGDAAAPAPKRRTTIREKTEAGVEDEFRIDTSGSKLNLDDLLAPLATQSSSLQTLKKSTKILGSSKTKALSAPLPQRAQERLDREAAYEKTKEEVDKWSGTMKKIREAEHLSFPLQAEKPSRVSNSELTAKFKPTTPMESAVSSLLASANLSTDILIHDTESSMLTQNNLTLEEVAARRAELRKMRELMFRAETKARRVKKIKSKTYRKLRRKEKERLAEQLGDNSDSDEEGGDEEKQRKRAMERATLRHKHTGKWAKQMKSKHLDVDQRKELEEMLDKGEKLRRKIQGVGSDDDEDNDSSEEESGSDAEEAVERIKSNAFDELQKLKASVEDGGEEESGKKKSKSIFEMKFMKDAMARQQAAANREVDDFIKELGAHSGEDDDDGSGQEDDQEANHDPQSGVLVHRAGGRVVYRPGAAPTKPTISIPSSSMVPPPSDTSSVTLKSTDFLSPPPISPVQPATTKDIFTTRTSAAESSAFASSSSNPWLTVQSGAGTGKISKRKNEVVVSKESKSAEKSKNKLSKAQRKKEEEKERERDDAELDILTGDVLTLGDGEVTPKPNVKGKGKERAKQAPAAAGASPAGDEDEDGHNSELEYQEQVLQAKAQGKGKGKAAPGAFQQRDLVALAFAGDNVVKEFEEAKKREIAEDAPKEVDTTIPGWGSWGGTGLRPKPPKASRIKKIAGVDPTTRVDYNKKHIIISEKKDKKASKYLVQDLPYPYTSQAQFEKALDRPLGVQWNTRSAFQRATLPRVVKKPGVVITPLEKKA